VKSVDFDVMMLKVLVHGVHIGHVYSVSGGSSIYRYIISRLDENW
jgi:hypothetical protein